MQIPPSALGTKGARFASSAPEAHSPLARNPRGGFVVFADDKYLQPATQAGITTKDAFPYDKFAQCHKNISAQYRGN